MKEIVCRTLDKIGFRLWLWWQGTVLQPWRGWKAGVLGRLRSAAVRRRARVRKAWGKVHDFAATYVYGTRWAPGEPINPEEWLDWAFDRYSNAICKQAKRARRKRKRQELWSRVLKVLKKRAQYGL
jgi:hypothetical protein